ncbi:hypothetical protein ACS0TY_032686 [Phlomoides rotata]
MGSDGRHKTVIHSFNSGGLLGQDADVILRTSISPHGFCDRLIWHHNKDGRYSVKSGYNIAYSFDVGSGLREHGNLRRLWSLKVVPKIRDCLWHVCRDVLPLSL